MSFHNFSSLSNISVSYKIYSKNLHKFQQFSQFYQNAMQILGYLVEKYTMWVLKMINTNLMVFPACRKPHQNKSSILCSLIILRLMLTCQSIFRLFVRDLIQRFIREENWFLIFISQFRDSRNVLSLHSHKKMIHQNGKASVLK